MALISLRNIGKIYVSEGVVAVGIRGVNLSFDRGEFVAITGKSGSGKSTLLNVISGMDSYEEGELYIEGNPTSHYAQADWEAYRRRYISFVFQDYNIVDSFTVLQNVELALMHIENAGERRKRAMELIRRVGLDSHIRHKGSQLSGGQKQRTVIARALAKDSPVLLADEPTGNLDSETSKEIIALLREISKEKLVILVTHNFEEVAEYATRHIRIYDGGVESDRQLAPPAQVTSTLNTACAPITKDSFFRRLHKGFLLGRVRFTAKPKLALFLCLLMCLSTVAATLVTALSGDLTQEVSKEPIFIHRDGRLIVSPLREPTITKETFEALRQSKGVRDSWRCDYLLDHTLGCYFYEGGTYVAFNCDYDDGTKMPDIGRRPAAVNEVMLSVPIGFRDLFGQDQLLIEHLSEVSDQYIGMDLSVVGVSYFYDNTKNSSMVFTREGFDIFTYLELFRFWGSFSVTLTVDSGEKDSWSGVEIYVAEDFPENSVGWYAMKGQPAEMFTGIEGLYGNLTLDAGYGNDTAEFYSYVGDSRNIGDDREVIPENDAASPLVLDLSKCRYITDLPDAFVAMAEQTYISSVLILSPDLFLRLIENDRLMQSYTQVSLLYENDAAARKQIKALNDAGYFAVLSDATSNLDPLEALGRGISMVFTAVFWLFAMLFIAFFLNLCSNKAMLASAGDIAIMRSMGISLSVIRISVFVQTILALIPAFAVSAIVFVAIYLTPATNLIFRFLHVGEYFLIALGVFLISVRMAGLYVKRMFRTSVKKTLKGETMQ